MLLLDFGGVSCFTTSSIEWYRLRILGSLRSTVLVRWVGVYLYRKGFISSLCRLQRPTDLFTEDIATQLALLALILMVTGVSSVSVALYTYSLDASTPIDSPGALKVLVALRLKLLRQPSRRLVKTDYPYQIIAIVSECESPHGTVS